MALTCDSSAQSELSSGLPTALHEVWIVTMPHTRNSTRSEKSAAPREVRPSTPSELDELRRSFREASEWARKQLAIDPELKHLGPSGGEPPGSDDA